MFDTLSDRLGSVFDRLRGRGALSEADVRAAMREVRVALLEADVALPVARDFVEQVTDKAVGQEVLRSVTPGQMVVKIVHDALVETLGSETAELNLNVNPPAVVMMVGLQGSGKTTTTAKLAKRRAERERKKVLMASLDFARTAARAAARRCRCARSPASRSSSPASAKRSISSRRSILSGSPGASSAWATSSAWSSAPPRPFTSRKPKSSRPRWPRASSTSMIY